RIAQQTYTTEKLGWFRVLFLRIRVIAHLDNVRETIGVVRNVDRVSHERFGGNQLQLETFVDIERFEGLLRFYVRNSREWLELACIRLLGFLGDNGRPFGEPNRGETESKEKADSHPAARAA